MDAFLAIERILQFHHATTRQPLNVTTLRARTLRNGTPVSVRDIEHILQVWPAAYKMYNLRGQRVIEALDLPHNIETRRSVFMRRWQQKENLSHTSVRVGCVSKATPKKPGLNGGRSILMGRLAPAEPKVINAAQGTLLERIRAKEALLKIERSPRALERSRDKFLQSQIPKMSRVLAAVAGNAPGGVSVDIDRTMEILRTNLIKLGDDELERSLELLAEAQPAFCKIVRSGTATHVRLANNKQDLAGKLSIPEQKPVVSS